MLLVSLSVDGNSGGHAPAAAGEAAIKLRVMTFNIEWGGAHVSFDNVVEAIRRADADIAGIQEAEGNLERLAGQLGWHFDLRSHIVSRFPVVDPPGADGGYVLIEVEPGKVVAVANVHLPSSPSGPDALRDGATAAEVVEMESATRLPAIEPYLAALAPLVKRNFPVFLTGDFNAPAHTDPVLVANGGQEASLASIDWPVSRAVANAGFHDAWRSVYPDPASHPGLTWWAARPPLEIYTPGEDDARSRIDFVWFAGTVTVQSGAIAGEEGGPEVSLSVKPWPSDHRAVVAQFEVIPAPMPALVSAGRRVYRAGEDVRVRYRGIGAHNTLTVLGFGADEAPVFAQTVGESGQQVLSAQILKPGRYRVLLAGQNQPAGIENEFWVLARDARPSVSIDRDRYRSGEPIEIEWHGAPGNRFDYVGVFSAGTQAGYGSELAWAYLKAMPEGRLRLDAASSESGWPLEPGAYLVRMMKDDGYEQMAESSAFVVE